MGLGVGKRPERSIESLCGLPVGKRRTATKAGVGGWDICDHRTIAGAVSSWHCRRAGFNLDWRVGKGGPRLVAGVRRKEPPLSLLEGRASGWHCRRRRCAWIGGSALVVKPTCRRRAFRRRPAGKCLSVHEQAVKSTCRRRVKWWICSGCLVHFFLRTPKVELPVAGGTPPATPRVDLQTAGSAHGARVKVALQTAGGTVGAAVGRHCCLGTGDRPALRGRVG